MILLDRKKLIGLRIKTMRKSRKMTQADLANAINQSQSSITMYENGRREPDFETLEALADTFNVPLSSIVADDIPDYDRLMLPIINTTASTSEARIISGGIDRMPPEKREQALKIMQAAFVEYADYFKEEK